MNSSIYRRLKAKAVRTSEKLGPPSFYDACRKELNLSRYSFVKSAIIRRCRSYIDERRLHPAHGLFHCEKVAVEAGALVQVELKDPRNKRHDMEDLVLCAQIAGLLHDITRNGKDHTVTGCLEAALILRDFDISEVHKRYIVAAIGNHEAFREEPFCCDDNSSLVGNCLYDADKFRWGPDNFTRTLWMITSSSGMPPETLHRIFREKMEVIDRIRHTFRTVSGRKYGPEFIDMGMKIGDEIYRELDNMLGD